MRISAKEKIYPLHKKIVFRNLETHRKAKMKNKGEVQYL